MMKYAIKIQVKQDFRLNPKDISFLGKSTNYPF